MDNERYEYIGATSTSTYALLTSLSYLQARISELAEKLAVGRAITSVRGHSEKARILGPLSIPAPSPPLERKDFQDVRFWTLQEWNDHKRHNESIRKLAFITTSGGGPIVNGRLEQMSEMARMLFNELHARGLAPSTWKAKSQTATDFFINTIVKKFPELRWCEGGSWKAEAFAVTRYPDCSRKFFNTGSLLIDIFHFQVFSRPFSLQMTRMTTHMLSVHSKGVRSSTSLRKSDLFRPTPSLPMTLAMMIGNHLQQLSQIRLSSAIIIHHRHQPMIVCRKIL